MAAQQRERAHHSLDDSFMAHGACRLPEHATEVAAGIFFRENSRDASDKFATLRAKAICASCPVEIECRIYAVDGNLDDGVWGGTDGDERQRMRRRQRRAATV